MFDVFLFFCKSNVSNSEKKLAHHILFYYIETLIIIYFNLEQFISINLFLYFFVTNHALCILIKVASNFIHPVF